MFLPCTDKKLTCFKKLSCLLQSFPFYLEDVSSFLDFLGGCNVQGGPKSGIPIPHRPFLLHLTSRTSCAAVAVASKEEGGGDKGNLGIPLLFGHCCSHS